MKTSQPIQFIPSSRLDPQAVRDRQAVFAMCQKPFTGYQLGLAMVDAAVRSQMHPLATQIGRTVRNMPN